MPLRKRAKVQEMPWVVLEVADVDCVRVVILYEMSELGPKPACELRRMMEQVTEHVGGQYSGQVMASPHSGLHVQNIA